MPRAPRRSPDATRSKSRLRHGRPIGVALALVALALTALAPGETASAPAPAPDATSVRGVASQVGQSAPEFSVTTLDGLSLTSADLLAQEKPYILYFFASW
jgi:hypothetical protein